MEKIKTNYQSEILTTLKGTLGSMMNEYDDNRQYFRTILPSLRDNMVWN